VWPGGPRAATGPRGDRRVRAVLERELRPAGRVRAGPQEGKAGGVTDGSDRTRRAGAVSDGRPRDRDLPGHQCPTGAGVRGVHRSPAPVAMVGTGGVHHHHHAGVRVPRRRGVVFVMHGPDGTDYQEWISWTEIAPPERIALLHGESRGDPNAFESVLTFVADGAATRIEMRTVFPTKELRDDAVEKYHAIEGGQQTLSNLAAYVNEIVRKRVED